MAADPRPHPPTPPIPPSHKLDMCSVEALLVKVLARLVTETECWGLVGEMLILAPLSLFVRPLDECENEPLSSGTVSRGLRSKPEGRDFREDSTRERERESETNGELGDSG